MWWVRNRRLRMTDALAAQPRRSYKFKVSRAIVVASVDNTYSALSFALVYLLYPGTSKLVFEMFRCRTVEHADGGASPGR